MFDTFSLASFGEVFSNEGLKAAGAFFAIIIFWFISQTTLELMDERARSKSELNKKQD